MSWISFKELGSCYQEFALSHFFSLPDRVSAPQPFILLPFLATAGRAAASVAIALASVLFASLGSSCF